MDPFSSIAQGNNRALGFFLLDFMNKTQNVFASPQIHQFIFHLPACSRKQLWLSFPVDTAEVIFHSWTKADQKWNLREKAERSSRCLHMLFLNLLSEWSSLKTLCSRNEKKLFSFSEYICHSLSSGNHFTHLWRNQQTAWYLRSCLPFPLCQIVFSHSCESL